MSSYDNKYLSITNYISQNQYYNNRNGILTYKLSYKIIN